jgi:hypothetical protein
MTTASVSGLTAAKRPLSSCQRLANWQLLVYEALSYLVYDYCLCLRLDSGDSAAAFVPTAQFASNYEKFITGKVLVYAALSY